MSLPRPEVFSLADGGLLLRWQGDGWTGEVEIDADADVVVMLDGPEDRRAGMGPELWLELARSVQTT